MVQVYPSQGLTLLNASGYVVAQRKSALASKVTGRLIWLGVEEGSRIKKGEVIARLESEDVEAAEKQAAGEPQQCPLRTSIRQGRAKRCHVGNEPQQGTGQQGSHRSSGLRYCFRPLSKGCRRSRAAEAAVRAATPRLEAANVAVEYTQIRAPFDAVVLTKNADVGDIVTPDRRGCQCQVRRGHDCRHGFAARGGGCFRI